MVSTPYNIIIVLGPTASGKTALAVDLAQIIDGEIISADSRQVYKGMDIGTGKDLDEYAEVNYHLIDIVPAGSRYLLGDYQKDFEKVLFNIWEKGKTPILCGGTGLYINAVLNQFQYTQIPENYELREKLDLLDDLELLRIVNTKKKSESTDLSTRKRIIRAIEIADFLSEHPEFEFKESNYKLNPFVIGIDPPLDQRRDRISKRLASRIDNGLVEEVKGLIDKGVDIKTLEYYGLEYKFVAQYLQGLVSFGEMHKLLTVAIQQFAKRQMTYFRSMERAGLKINWLKF